MICNLNNKSTFFEFPAFTVISQEETGWILQAFTKYDQDIH